MNLSPIGVGQDLETVRETKLDTQLGEEQTHTSGVVDDHASSKDGTVFGEERLQKIR